MKKVIVQMLLMAWLPMVAFAISVEKYVAFTLHYSNPDRVIKESIVPHLSRLM